LTSSALANLRAPYRTPGGRLLDLADPKVEDLDLEDIAHNLARVCRFGGAVDEFYSVASHSVYVARQLEAQGAALAVVRAGLLHDATEAYLGDMVSGLKRLCPEYRSLEDVWAGCVEARFDVRLRRDPHKSIIKEADLRARLAECRDLFVHCPYPRELLLGGEGDRLPFAARCVAQTPDEAEWDFIAEARRLGVGS